MTTQAIGSLAQTTTPASGSALQNCFAIAPICTLRAKEMLFAEGADKSHVYKIETGAIVIYKVLSDGNRQVVDLALPGDIVGLEAGYSRAHDAQAMTPARLRALTLSILNKRAREDANLAADLYDMVARSLSRAHDHFLTIGWLSATARLATFLLAFSRRREEKGFDAVNLNLPIRRSDIADFLCMSVETVSRSLTELKSTGLIALEGWRRVTLLNRAALAKVAAGGA
jgi:CRP-like cAMP-binding protein